MYELLANLAMGFGVALSSNSMCLFLIAMRVCGRMGVLRVSGEFASIRLRLQLTLGVH